MISKEGKDISHVFAGFRDYNYKVFNFNTSAKMSRGMAKLTDLIVIGKKSGIHFIEIKLKSTNDRYSKEQLETRDYIISNEGQLSQIKYWMAESYLDALNIRERILQREW